MDLLKRAHAPITDEAWKLIDAEARSALSTALVARRVVDVVGPKGWTHSAVGLGRLDVPKQQPIEGVRYGIHRVQPLVEVRARCELEIWELDDASRGAADVDLAPLTAAARCAARFENTAVLQGFEPGGISGLSGSKSHEPVKLPLEPDGALDAVSQALLTQRRASVEGPYALLLGPKPLRFLASSPTGYPLLRQVERLVEGPVLETDVLEGGLLVSQRGGDFELTIGQDLSVGHESHDDKVVRLFVTESFTFRLLVPEAVVSLELV